MNEVFNPQADKRCIDCIQMWCKEYRHKTEQWNGYCSILHKKVQGYDVCHLPRQPPAMELELFSYEK